MLPATSCGLGLGSARLNVADSGASNVGADSSCRPTGFKFICTKRLGKMNLAVSPLIILLQKIRVLVWREAAGERKFYNSD